MSKYTTEVRFICEEKAGEFESTGGNRVNEIIEKAKPKIFDFDFPIFDEAYRGVLCTKILKHYYTREIGLETYGLWKLKLDTKLNEIMPYYNQLYKSELLEFNPLYDTDITTTHTLAKNGTSKDVIDNKAKSKADMTNYDLFSDTPQGSLNGVESEEYLTTARKITDVNNLTAEGTENRNNEMRSLDEYVEHVTGKRNATDYSKLLNEFRKTFLNIDMMIIGELEELFMHLW